MITPIYTTIYEILIFLISLFSCLYILQKGKRNELPVFPSIFLMIFLCFLILMIGLCPAEYGSDKSRYEVMFVNAPYLDLKKDIGWQYYVVLFNRILPNTIVFFLVTAAFYVWSNYRFIRAFVPRDKVYYLFLLTVVSLGFLSYGVNTIRAGVALGFVLLAFINKDKKIIFLILSLIAVAIHKSMLIPIISFVIPMYFHNTKTYLGLWLLMLCVSLLDISIFSEAIQMVTDNIDNRVEGYLSATQDANYLKVGFRWDFVIYSMIPIVIGYVYIYKKGFTDRFYCHLYNCYLLANSLWLIVIRIPYTDRFAYLSWFLMPILLLYPLLRKKDVFNRQPMIVTVIIFFLSALNFTMNVLR